MIKDSKEDSQEEKFLSRWSRRKQEIDDQGNDTVQQVDEADAPKIPLNTILPSDTKGRMVTKVEADRLREEKAEAEPVLTDEDMPPVESLTPESDFTGFMSPGVSDGLRKLALRKLFAGAGFNIRDGLDDYDEDFTKFEALGDIVTCDMKHQQEMAEKRKKEAEEEAHRIAAEQGEAEEQSVDADQIQEQPPKPDDDADSDQIAAVEASEDNLENESVAELENEPDTKVQS